MGSDSQDVALGCYVVAPPGRANSRPARSCPPTLHAWIGYHLTFSNHTEFQATRIRTDDLSEYEFQTSLNSMATRVRYRVVFMTTVMAILLYLDRFCVSFAEIFIKQDLGLPDYQIGWLQSCFFGVYALAQVPSGWLTDRFGGRLMLTIYIIIWSTFTAMMGFAWGIASLLLFRGLIGLGQAGAYPTGANLVSKWIPFGQRGMASSGIALGGRIGGAIAPVLTAFLIVLFVPVSVDSKLQESDLIDAKRFAQSMSADKLAADEPVSRAAKYVYQQLSVDAQTQLIRAADAEEPTNADVALGWGELIALVDKKDFYNAGQQAFEKLNVEKEGKRLQAKASRTDDESRRLNRLLLEATFPASIKKVYVKGWRKVMFAYGLFGFLIAAAYWWVVRDRPSAHPSCNEEEQELIVRDVPKDSASTDGPVKGVPLKHMVTHRSVWMMSIAEFGTNIGWIFVATWMIRYLAQHHGVPVETRGLMASWPPIAGVVGIAFGGVLTDWMVKRFGLRWGRSLPMALTRFTGAGAYLYCLWGQPTDPWHAVFAFCVVSFSTGCGTGAGWAFKSDIGGPYVGSLLGWCNMWGNLGATVAPIWLISIISVDGEYYWDHGFILCGSAFVVAGVAGFFIDASKPLMRKDEG